MVPQKKGCLEVFLAEALRTIGEDDKKIVDGCRGLVAAIPDQPYLSEPRFRPKAVIGATLSIMSPDWVFGDLDEKLIAIEWEKIQDANAAYERLGDLQVASLSRLIVQASDLSKRLLDKAELLRGRNEHYQDLAWWITSVLFGLGQGLGLIGNLYGVEESAGGEQLVYSV